MNFDPERPEELAPLTGLINRQDPPNSALFRFFDRDFDHQADIPAGLSDEYVEAVTTWIASLQR